MIASTASNRHTPFLYSHQAAEFGDMRYMYANSVADFLNRWKA